MKNLSTKVVLVTGASRGIGAEIALEFAKAGAKLVVNYVGNKLAAENVVKEIVDLGSEAIAIQADMSKKNEVKRLFDQSVEHFGKLASMNAYKRLGNPSDIAKVVVFLATDEAKWISGQSLGANGGMA